MRMGDEIQLVARGGEVERVSRSPTFLGLMKGSRVFNS